MKEMQIAYLRVEKVEQVELYSIPLVLQGMKDELNL